MILAMLETANSRSTCKNGGIFFMKFPKVGRASPAITILLGPSATMDMLSILCPGVFMAHTPGAINSPSFGVKIFARQKIWLFSQ